MSDEFQIRVRVRMDDIDANGHAPGAAYLVYADQARWEMISSAGADLQMLNDKGFGPVNLETTVSFRNELRAHDDVDVSCRFLWGDGKTFRVTQMLSQTDGTLAAEVSSVSGLLDLKTRRLVPQPAATWRAVASRPEVLGL